MHRVAAGTTIGADSFWDRYAARVRIGSVGSGSGGVLREGTSMNVGKRRAFGLGLLGVALATVASADTKDPRRRLRVSALRHEVQGDARGVGDAVRAAAGPPPGRRDHLAVAGGGLHQVPLRAVQGRRREIHARGAGDAPRGGQRRRLQDAARGHPVLRSGSPGSSEGLGRLAIRGSPSPTSRPPGRSRTRPCGTGPCWRRAGRGSRSPWRRRRTSPGRRPSSSAGELLRRLGAFEEAKGGQWSFQRAGQGEESEAEPFPAMIRQEMALIGAKDASPKTIETDRKR